MPAFHKAALLPASRRLLAERKGNNEGKGSPGEEGDGKRKIRRADERGKGREEHPRPGEPGKVVRMEGSV